MKTFIALALVVVSLFFAATTVSAQSQGWKCTSSTASTNCANDAGQPPLTKDPAGAGRCTATYWAQNANQLSLIKTDFNSCGDDGSTCCIDPCTIIPNPSVASCVAVTNNANPLAPEPLCAWYPLGDSAGIATFNCILMYKLCLLNTPTQCAATPLCQWNNQSNLCLVRQSYTVAQQTGNGLSNCPALAGVVVAFLVLMFISLVGAIVFVIVVVIYKQKKQDEEDKKAQEEAEAAEAAAKAQQQEAADF